MNDQELKQVHKALIGFSKRAEKSTEALLVSTFVDSEPLFDLLSTRNNQVIYGRRGTGKTHALKYLLDAVRKEGDAAIYIDLRAVGSNGSIYNDQEKTLATRAATLLVDVMSAIQGELEDVAIDQIDYHPNPDQLTALVDELRTSITTLRVTGPMSIEVDEKVGKEASASGGLGVSISSLSAKFGLSSKTSNSSERKASRVGNEVVHLDFGSIAKCTKALLERLNLEHVWLLLDEWSEIPFELQPFLSDLLRRTLITVPNVTVKIAAIEHRSVFSIQRPNGEYIGLELGADIFADLNLDNFLVFDNDQEKATNFFKTLIYRHYKGSDGALESIDSSDSLIAELFTQFSAFQEFVRAVEGVPRDALNLASAAATKAYGKRISINDVRGAARDWYQQDKAAITRTTPELATALTHVVDEVIGRRRTRAFLYANNSRHIIIDQLFDARLLHILKRNVSSNEQPGVRYDVYKIDYGCYVELINTSRAPESLLVVDDDESIDVPKDDYRSIRRAILKEEDLESVLNPQREQESDQATTYPADQR